MKTLVVLVAAGFLPVWASFGGGTFGSDALSVSFAGPDDGYSVTAIENRMEGRAKFVRCPRGTAGLWRLQFVRKGASGTNEFFTVDNLVPAVRSLERKDGSIELNFKDIDLKDEKGVLDVKAVVEFSEKAPASRWRLKVVNRSLKSALYLAAYPLLRNVVEPGRADVMAPHNILGGKLFKGYEGRASERKMHAPGWRSPLAAYNLGEAGLYIAAHDPSPRQKDMVFGTGTDLRFECVVENAGVPGKAADGPGFPVVIAAYRGDWWDAAKIYRAWAMKQVWTAKGPIARRSDYPAAMTDTDIWVRFNSTDALAVSNNIVRMKKIWPGLKVGVHWYCWHGNPYVVNFPEFFPARKGVKEVVRFGRDNGYVMMPYVDFRLWDKELASWAYAKNDALAKIDGSFYEEVYYTKRDFAIMCPTEALGAVAEKMTRDALDVGTPNGCGFNGIYYDQTACSWGPPCWNPAHGHPLGGGDWWWKRHREILKPLHGFCSARNIPITSEGTGEMYLDLIDGHLGIGALPCQDDVPLHPALYSGYTVYFGSSQSLRDPIESFYRVQAQAFVRGVVPGWHDRYNVTSPEFARQQKYIGDIARFRRCARKFMVYGFLDNEVRMLDEQKKIPCKVEQIWRPQYSAVWMMPDVFGTVWTNLDGATAVIVANAASEKRTVRFKSPAPALRVRSVEGFAAPDMKNEDGVVTLGVPPRGFAFLETP